MTEHYISLNVTNYFMNPRWHYLPANISVLHLYENYQTLRYKAGWYIADQYAMVLNSLLLSGVELMLVQGVLKHFVTFFPIWKTISLFLSVLQNI